MSEPEKKSVLDKAAAVAGAVTGLLAGLTAALRLLTGEDAVLAWLALTLLALVALGLLAWRWWKAGRTGTRSRRVAVLHAALLILACAGLGVLIGVLTRAAGTPRAEGSVETETTRSNPTTTHPTTTTTGGSTPVPTPTTSATGPTRTTTRPTTTTTTANPPPPPLPLSIDPPGTVPHCHDYTGTGDQPPGYEVVLLIRQADSQAFYSEGAVTFVEGGVWFADNKIVGRPGDTGPFVISAYQVTPAQLAELEKTANVPVTPVGNKLDEKTAIRTLDPDDC